MSDSLIPASWSCCLIGEITKVVGGATPPANDPNNFSEEEGIPWITPADLSGYHDTYIERGRRNLTEKGFSSCSAAMMPKNTVLFSSRAPIGYVAIAANPVCTNQGFKSFVPSSALEPLFLYYYLKFLRPEAEARATGTTFKELSGKSASSLPLVIAPLNEQRRIAAKLDTALAAVDACRQRLDGVEALLKRFRQAVLAAATSGELTREWREGVDATYEQLPFRDLVVDSRTGLVRSSQEQHEPSPDLSPYLKMDAIGENWGCSYQGYSSVRLACGRGRLGSSITITFFESVFRRVSPRIGSRSSSDLPWGENCSLV